MGLTFCVQLYIQNSILYWFCQGQTEKNRKTIKIRFKYKKYTLVYTNMTFYPRHTIYLYTPVYTNK